VLSPLRLLEPVRYNATLSDVLRLSQTFATMKQVHQFVVVVSDQYYPEGVVSDGTRQLAAKLDDDKLAIILTDCRSVHTKNRKCFTLAAYPPDTRVTVKDGAEHPSQIPFLSTVSMVKEAIVNALDDHVRRLRGRYGGQQFARPDAFDVALLSRPLENAIEARSGRGVATA
jgi:hypothetical protein